MNPRDENIKEKSLRLSFFKGAFGCFMTGLIQDYITPFILFLGGQSRHVGIYNSATNLAASLIQLVSADLVSKFGSRKKMVAVFVALQGLMLALIVILGINGVLNYWRLIILAVLFSVMGNIFIPAWLSVLSDLVDEKRRGEYFGWRSHHLGFLTVMGLIIAGVILHFTAQHNSLYGFLIIIGAACCSRLMSLVFLNPMVEPEHKTSRADAFSFVAFIRRLRESNFAKFVLFVGMMNFSVNLAAPFFAVFMIKDLHLSYFTYTAIIAAAPLMLYLMVRNWGMHADVVGNLQIVRATSRLVAFIPILWILCQDPVYLFLVEMLSGFLWAGFNLCTANFIFDVASPQKRTRCIAYFNVVNGVSLALGALIGGFLVNRLPPLMGYKILTLFAISSGLRMIVSTVMPQFLKEIRPVTDIKSTDLFFSMIRMRPILGPGRPTARAEG